MGNFKISCREQLMASAVAIHDWATDVGERQGIDWTLYDNVTVAQAFAPVAIIGQENERVRNMHREFWRKVNYEELLDVTGRMNVRMCEHYYHRMHRQIRNNFWVSNTREKFGIDTATMAKLMKIKERSVQSFENFHEFTDDPAMLHAFRVTQHIPAPKWEEWGRKYRRALREYRAAAGGPRMIVGSDDMPEAIRATRRAVDAVCNTPGNVTE
jgi:hypothetical protein